MNYRDIFSERLKTLRQSHGLSQKSLGEILEVTDASINMMERAKRSPSFEVLLAIADHFNVSLDYLVGRSDDPERR